jgi:thiol-disulfide isomerase/thioredoxin
MFPLMVLSLFLTSCLGAEVRVGDRFPPLTEAAADRAADLPALSGRVVLVDFWASWCAPCKASFPAYAQLHADYAGRGLTIVAVSVDEKPAAYEAFIRQTRPPFATLLDREHRLTRLVAVPAMPTCFLIGRDGRVRSMHTGFHGADSERELRREIEAALATKTASP